MKEVVITGLGTINPIGLNIRETLKNSQIGRSGIESISRFDHSSLYSKFAAEVSTHFFEHISNRDSKRLDTSTLFALVASKEAMHDSGLDLDTIDKSRFSVIVGNGFGGVSTIDSEINKKISPFFITKILSNMISAALATEFNVYGTAYTLNTACASSTDAIGQAFFDIRSGRSDFALTGGTEASLNKVIFTGFEAIHALSTSDKKETASAPFDLNRNGFIMGEGAGMLILEEKQHAISRNAHIYAELKGYGSTNDAFNPVLPNPDGKLAIDAINNAISMGGVKKNEISLISAHGTGTVANDKTETKILKEVFKDHANRLTISSLKGLVGHTLGASGAIELIISLLLINSDTIPGTFGLNTFDPSCDLNYSPGANYEGIVKYFIKESFGFGGHNAALCLKVGNIIEE